MTSIQTAVFYLFRTAASPTRSEQTSHSYPDTHSSTCGAHGTRCIFSPIAFRLSGTRSLDRSISIPFFSPQRQCISRLGFRRRGDSGARQSRAAGEAAGTRTHRQQSSPWPAVTVGGGAPHGSARALDPASRLEAWRRDGQRPLPSWAGTSGSCGNSGRSRYHRWRRPRESDPGSGGSW